MQNRYRYGSSIKNTSEKSRDNIGIGTFIFTFFPRWQSTWKNDGIQEKTNTVGSRKVRFCFEVLTLTKSKKTKRKTQSRCRKTDQNINKNTEAQTHANYFWILCLSLFSSSHELRHCVVHSFDWRGEANDFYLPPSATSRC